MARVFYSLVALLWMMISCQSSSPDQKSPEAESVVSNTDAAVQADAAGNTDTGTPPATDAATPVSMAGDYTMKPDTIEIYGKFLPGCDMPKVIKIAEHNEVGNAGFKEVSVNASGDFRYKMFLAEPRRIAVKTEKRTMYDFIATTKEKKFRLDIACANGMEKPELKNSPENVPYRLFSNANKKFREELDSFAKQDWAKPETFAKLKGKITTYQKTLSEIASAHPGTFTANVLCAAEKLPEGSLNSLDALRKNFLQREAFANPYIYNDFLGQRILLNYLSICDRKADQENAINGMMNIAAKNPDASKRLQQICYNIFYNRHEEQFIAAYIKWAEAYPTSMHNQSVKMQLQRLKYVMPGNKYIDILLKDPAGATKKLSETVASASKLTLLIFYSPTCEHCQAEIPQLKPLWEQYKNKGLKIYTAGFDATNEEWNWFIKNKGSAEWTNVFEYPDGTLYSYQYVVNYTPTYVFISPDGKIISRFPTFDEVKARLPELMK